MKKGNTISLISRIHENSSRFLIKELEEEGIKGIVPSHGEILKILFDEQTCTMAELAKRIHRTKPTVTILVNKLIDYGYVVKERSPNDGRVMNIILTQKGLDLKPTVIKISKKMNDLVYNNLTDCDAEWLEETLQNINKRFSN